MGEMLYRELKVSCRILDKEAREVEFTAATETPVNMGWGPPEVLRMSGATFEESIPLLNAHSRKSIFDVLGRAMPRKDKRELACRVRFSKSTKEADAAWALVDDKTIDSVSVGYFVNEYRELRDGEVDMEDGDELSRVVGPAIVAKKWQAKELSLVPIGADPNARRRAFEGARKENDMFPKPNPGETREQFLARAQSDASVVAQFPDEVKRRAAAEQSWTDAQPKPTAPPALVPAPAPAPAPAPKPTPGPTGARTIDDELAAEIEGRKRLIFSFCPPSLRAFAEEKLLENPMIGVEEMRKALLAERVRQLPPGGTPEPRMPDPKKQSETAPPASAPAPTPNPAPEERNDLVRFLNEVH